MLLIKKSFTIMSFNCENELEFSCQNIGICFTLYICNKNLSTFLLRAGLSVCFGWFLFGGWGDCLGINKYFCVGGFIFNVSFYIPGLHLMPCMQLQVPMQNPSLWTS